MTIHIAIIAVLVVLFHIPLLFGAHPSDWGQR